MASALGDYLRARRAQVASEEAGVPVHGTRRVAGLRREEVAMLSGISADYYIRLEQGREQRPSASVLDALAALAAVLRLDDDARMHLYQVAGLTPASRRAPGAEQIDPELSLLMERWPDTPAIVLGRAYDVLAGNALGYALFDGFRQGANLLVKIFLDPEARSFYPDWEQVARYTVAGFRRLQGRHPDDPRIQEVVAELSAASPEFSAIWERHEARGQRLASKRFRHPRVGELTLRIAAFDVRSAPDQELIVYHAEPGSPSEDALRRLAATLATDRMRANPS